MSQPSYRVHLTRTQPLIINQTNPKLELKKIFLLLEKYLSENPLPTIRIELSPNYEKEIKSTGFHGFGLAEVKIIVSETETEIETIDIALIKEGNNNLKLILMPAHSAESYDTENDPWGFERKNTLDHLTTAVFEATRCDVSVCLSDTDEGPKSVDDALKNWLKYSRDSKVRNVPSIQ